MLKPNFAIYLGEEVETGFTGFVCQDNFFCLLETGEGLSKDEGRGILKKLTDDLEFAKIGALADFDSYFANHWKQSKLPTGFSFVALFLNDNLSFLKTINLGQIYLKRGNQFTKLISENNSASGYVQPNDLFILTTENMTNLLNENSNLQKIVVDKSPKQIVDDLSSIIPIDKSKGTIGLFISFAEEERAEELETETDYLPKQRIQVPLDFKKTAGKIVLKIKNFIQQQDRNKKLAFAAVAILFFLFISNIIGGYQKRSGAQKGRDIQTTRDLITEKLHQAEDVSGLNMQRAIVLINESKQDLANLKKEINDNNNKDIVFLQQLISSEELKILKKEEKTSQEYFDLSVENKKASGQKMSLNKDNAAILDPQGIIYTFSLSKKSIDKQSSSDIKEASLVGIDDRGTLFFNRKNAGIFQISSDGKIKKAIDNDTDWGNIVDMVLYDNNIYLLDKTKNQIYKYLVSENGFSQKNQYFKAGQGIDLSNANSLTIDGSVYISLASKVVKYTSGVADDFSNTFPDQDININKVFTNPDLTRVYQWDKAKGAIYVVSKTGDYEKQIKSAVLSKASDIGIFANNAYALVGAKIYTIDLN